MFIEHITNSSYYRALETYDKIVNTSKGEIEEIIEEYIKYQNLLYVTMDIEEEWDNFVYLNELCRLLKSNIAYKCLKEHGYYIDTDDTYHRWRKDT